VTERDAIYVGHLGPIPLYVSIWFLGFIVIVGNFTGGFGNLEKFLLVFTVLLVGIILHELGHGLTAKAFGATGISITLGMFGGLCRSNRQRRPGSEIAILAAGPLVSFALSGLGYGLLQHLDPRAPDFVPVGLDRDIVHIILYDTYWYNLVLGIFNSLPIFPLDGGQIVFNALKLVTKRENVVRQVSMTLAVAGAIAVLAWEMNRSHDFPLYMTVLFAWLLFQAHVYLHQ
jgi:Zn-dependent protease